MKGWEIISTYTRADALADGVLLDKSEIAKEAGFVVPVAVTANLWNRWIVPPPEMEKYGQDTTGRLWDVLSLLRLAAKKGGSRIVLKVLFQNKPTRRELIRIVSVIGPGDHGEPVVTIMLPEDD